VPDGPGGSRRAGPGRRRDRLAQRRRSRGAAVSSTRASGVSRAGRCADVRSDARQERCRRFEVEGGRIRAHFYRPVCDPPGPRGAVSRFIAADGFFMSAGLAFFFLVCLIPPLLPGCLAWSASCCRAREAGRGHVVGQLAEQFPGLSGADCSGSCFRIGPDAHPPSGCPWGTAALVVFSTPVPQRLTTHPAPSPSAWRGGDGGAFLRNLVARQLGWRCC